MKIVVGVVDCTVVNSLVIDSIVIGSIVIGKDLLISVLMKNTNIKIKQYKPNLKKTKHKFRFKVYT